MRHIIFQEASEYPVALLIKVAAFNKDALINNYILPLEEAGITRDKIIAFSLEYQGTKAPAKVQKDYLAHLLPALQNLGVKYLYCCDGNYFKTLVKDTKSEVHLGYSIPCGIKGFESMQVVLGINHHAVIYDANQEAKLQLANKTLADVLNGSYKPIGQDIIQGAYYPVTPKEIADTLADLLEYKVLAADIETFSLSFKDAGIGTIAFALNKHHGVAFRVDYEPYPFDGPAPDGTYGYKKNNFEVRALLKKFFELYEGKLIWQGSTFDLRVLIYQLWMKHPLDREGLLTGLEVMTRSFDDTKQITYLATNSCAGNSLGLKEQAHEFAGNWAKDDINNILLVPLPELLQYNLVDALSTHYVFEKHWSTLIADNQLDIYENLFKPSLKTIICAELVGMPMNPTRVSEVKDELIQKQNECLNLFKDNVYIAQVNQHIQTEAMKAANAKLKTKQHPIEKFSDVVFNPNSGKHLQHLMYEVFKLPVIDYTDTKQPATGGDTLKKLVNHATNPDQKAIIQALIEYSQVNKILTSFIPAFENGFLKSDGISYLHGCFNLGGTVSGRLSSSDPNLQQIPANSTYAKLIKSCFQAPPGWLKVGADFSSLEDRINALLTKDKNKIKVYTDGYDGHSLRAFAYFGDQMSDIMETVASINSIKKTYDYLRQDSKAPTFALTYAGTYITLMKNLGWSEEKAKAVEKRFHELYAMSKQWVEARIKQAAKDGYAEAAFGLRIRTPLLKQSVLGTSKTLREAEAEARTLGNAISGQSYGLLTNRALNAFMNKVWASKYRLQIFPIAMIHDAIYLLIENSAEVVEWVNEHLIEEMEWQELPEIAHEEVKLGAELDIFYPSWASPLTLPNHVNQEMIVDMASEHIAKVKK